MITTDQIAEIEAIAHRRIHKEDGEHIAELQEQIRVLARVVLILAKDKHQRDSDKD